MLATPILIAFDASAARNEIIFHYIMLCTAARQFAVIKFSVSAINIKREMSYTIIPTYNVRWTRHDKVVRQSGTITNAIYF
jgi:hypothetical protein